MPAVTNAATVRGGADSDTTNNSHRDFTSVGGVPDLVLDKLKSLDVTSAPVEAGSV